MAQIGKIQIQWMIRCHLPQVLAIEQEVYSDPWPQEKFHRWLRDLQTIGLVAITDDRVIGYILYRYDRYGSRLDVLNLTALSEWDGVRAQLLARMQHNARKKKGYNLEVEIWSH